MANGKIASLSVPDRRNFPSLQAGELILAADLVTIRTDANGIYKYFKAFAGVTGGGNVQGAAIGVALKDLLKGQWDGIWKDAQVNGFSVTSGPLTGLLPMDDVFLSDVTPGAMTKTAPVGTGKLKQYVGRASYTPQYPASTDKADLILVAIERAVTL